MFRIVILFILINPLFAVEFLFTTYTHVSKTNDGTTCLTGCSPDTKECIINWAWQKASCRSYESAPIYLTSQFVDPQRKYCLSNCGYFGYPYQWCITTKELKWDYCSTNTYKVSSHAEEVVPKTRFEQNCVSKCTKDQTPNTGYYWCYYIINQKDGKWEYCAPPALPRVPVISSSYNFGDKLKGKCDQFLKQISGIRAPSYPSSADVADNYLVTLAEAIEMTEGKITLVNPTESIKSYTMMTVNGISVPVVVRAHVTNDTLHTARHAEIIPAVERKLRRQMANNGNGYEADYLIGLDIGGSNAEYNIVPTSIDSNCEYLLDSAVKNWCQETGGSVDILIVVFYVDSDTPVPKAFGVSQIFRNNDNSLFVDCREKMYWNDF